MRILKSWANVDWRRMKAMVKPVMVPLVGQMRTKPLTTLPDGLLGPLVAHNLWFWIHAQSWVMRRIG